jgi:hypothetical protein
VRIGWLTPIGLIASTIYDFYHFDWFKFSLFGPKCEQELFQVTTKSHSAVGLGGQASQGLSPPLLHSDWRGGTPYGQRQLS